MDHTCDGLQRLVQSQHKVKLELPTNHTTIVSSPAGCVGTGRAPMDAIVPTKDNDKCKVGYVCTAKYPAPDGTISEFDDEEES